MTDSTCFDWLTGREAYFLEDMALNRARLKHIHLSGYKSFGCDENALDMDLRDINLIIGANGSGKSNFLSFFSLLSHMMTNAFQIYVAKQGFADRMLHFGAKVTRHIKAELRFEDSHHTNAYRLGLEYAAGDKLIIRDETLEVDGTEKACTEGEKESFFSVMQPLLPEEATLQRMLHRCRAFQFHDTSAQSRIRMSASLRNHRYLMSDGGNLPVMLYLIKKRYPNYFRRIETYVQSVIPNFSSFVLEPESLSADSIFLNWVERGRPEYILGPSQFSDGSLRFIALATLLLEPPDLLPDVILIDEPELGLHPQAVDSLAHLLRQASRYAQVIVATQSERLLDAFAPEDVIVADYQTEKKCSAFRRLDADDLKLWLDSYSMAELWEKNLLGGQP